MRECVCGVCVRERKIEGVGCYFAESMRECVCVREGGRERERERERERDRERERQRKGERERRGSALSLGA